VAGEGSDEVLQLDEETGEVRDHPTRRKERAGRAHCGGGKWQWQRLKIW
jgi:hypothetical protein